MADNVETTRGSLCNGFVRSQMTGYTRGPPITGSPDSSVPCTLRETKPGEAEEWVRHSPCLLASRFGRDPLPKLVGDKSLT
jgi:hypothetical protein